jgi:hypothetical protein
LLAVAVRAGHAVHVLLRQLLARHVMVAFAQINAFSHYKNAKIKLPLALVKLLKLLDHSPYLLDEVRAA